MKVKIKNNITFTFKKEQLQMLINASVHSTYKLQLPQLQLLLK